MSVSMSFFPVNSFFPPIGRGVGAEFGDKRPLRNTWHDLTSRGIDLKVLTGQGATIDTTTSAGKLVFRIFAALVEFERELIAEQMTAGLASARARGRNGGWPYKMTLVKLRLAMASMGRPDTKVSALCQELGITRQTIMTYITYWRTA